MDNDDNDYHSQNFHLVGDNNSKVSSVLCPYALPKFDFDENLQGHLRFDSLVENEVFLGILSQEDNQWIEELSRGSSGLEFSPSAAESCSITRRNNVWSEAASSESVEMLLKSVVQEQNLQVDAIVEESDAANEFGNITQKMESNLREDENIETQVVEKYTCENIESREMVQITTEDCTQVELSSNDSNKVEVDALKNETFVNKMKVNSSASGVQVQSEECSPHAVTEGNSSECDKFCGTHLETTSGLPNDFCKGMEDNTIVNKCIAISDEKSTGLAFQADIPAASKDCMSNATLEEGVSQARVESTITNLRESSSLLGSLDPDLSTTELCKIDVPFTESPKVSESDIVASPKTTEIQHQYDDCSMLQEEISVACKSASATDGCVADVREVEGIEACSNIELEKCLALKIAGVQNPLAQKHNTMGSIISSDQRPSLASSERLSESFGPQIVSSIAQGCECGGIMDASIPAGILQERHATEGLEGGNEGVGTNKVVLGIARHVSSPAQTDKLIDSYIVVGSSSTFEDHREDAETTRSPELDTSVQNASVQNIQAPDVEVKNVNCSSHDTVDNVHNTLSKSSDVPPVLVNHPEKESSSVEEGSTHFGIKDEVNTICPREANPSPLALSFKMIDHLGPDGHTIPMAEASHIETTLGGATADVSQYCSTDEKIRGGRHDSLMKEGICDKTDTIGKHDGANDDGQHLSKSGETGRPVEPVAPTLASAVATSCTPLLLTEKNKQEVGDGADVEQIPPPQIMDSFAGKVQSTCMNSEVSSLCKEERNSNFKVTPVVGASEIKTSKDLQSFPSNRSSEVAIVEEGLPLVSVGAKADTRVILETRQVSDQVTPVRGTKAGSEHKTRRGSDKAGRKSTKGNQLMETPAKLTERMDKSLAARESSGTKSSGIVLAPTSNLPDLNTSIPSVLLQQPFTDSQQVQLRAQIFVYGSLIQGAVPDEACMGSAFGTTTNGARSIWEPAWHACVQKLSGQKSPVISTETPVRACSGAYTPDQAIKQGLYQSKVLSPPAAQSTSKGSSIPATTPRTPYSSPLWNKTTPCDSLPSSSVVSGAATDYQSFSSLNPWQTPLGRNFPGHTTWLPQTSLPSPWVASSQTAAFDVRARFPVLPITEPVKLTPIRESPSAASGRKHMPTNSMAPSVLSGILAENTSKIENKKPPLSPAGHKSRKRKKPSVTDGRGQISLPIAPAELVSASGLVSSVAISRSQTLSVPVVSSHCSTLVSVTASPSFVPKEKSDLVTASSFIVDHSKRVDINVVKMTLTSEDIKKVEEAKLQADEASAHAAAALDHCQGIWIELDKQNNSSLMPDIEAKLVSAAVAIAAAASVAKAAAAAAKVASDAAAQVKQMADEAMVSSKRRSENLVAIVNAAELAAEAVSHAGKVVMGDPIPLSELVKAGPDGYWKVSEPMPVQGVKSKDVNGEISDVNMVERGSDSDVFAKKSEGPSVMALHALKSGPSPHPGGTPAGNIDGNLRVEGISSSILCAEKDISSIKGPKTSEFMKALDVSIGPEIESRSTSLLQDDYGNIDTSAKGNSIKEGCLVEVLRDSGDLKAWFTANVLSLKDGNAYISYIELQSEEGSGQLKEWIPLRLDGNDVPSIRASHPMTAVHVEGARKRRRAAVKDYAWSVGDRVDAWMNNCWREGIVIEKNKKDETILSVNFPARGDTAVVRAWNLRPTLIWKDGEWVEWPTSRAESDFQQHDTPKEKRIKIGNPAGEISSVKAKLSKDIDALGSVANEEQELIPLSDNEKLFNDGSNGDENTLRTARSGLQKEGSKVVFGVPKPGKTKKFMEVSKHYVSDWGRKHNAADDSVKTAKHVGGRKENNSKTNPEVKEVAEFESRPLKPRKPPISSRASNLSTRCSSNSEETGEGQAQSSSETLRAETNKKVSKPSSNKPDKVNKGNIAPSSGESAKVEADKSIPEANEPRRSNRMIQPTSRLLESLQSSLSIPKLPSVSHNKRSQKPPQGHT